MSEHISAISEKNCGNHGRNKNDCTKVKTVYAVYYLLVWKFFWVSTPANFSIYYSTAKKGAVVLNISQSKAPQTFTASHRIIGFFTDLLSICILSIPKEIMNL